MITLLAPNQVVCRVGTTDDKTVWRVLAAEPGPDPKVCLIDVDRKNKRALPVWYDQAAFDARFGNDLEVCDDPHAHLIRSNSELAKTPNQLERRDERLAIIQPLLDDETRAILFRGRRGEAIAARSHETGASIGNILRYQRMWWQLGQLPNALAPLWNKCGGRGKLKSVGEKKRGRPRIPKDGRLGNNPGINITADIATQLQKGAKLLGTMSLRKAWRKIIRLYFCPQVMVDGQWVTLEPDEDAIPSFEQFRYWARKVLRPDEQQQARDGDKKYQANRRGRTGTTKNDASGPGAVFMIDATVFNVGIRRRGTNEIIGKPTVYLVPDQYSRAIVGWSRGFGPPCWAYAKLALENAVTDKVEYCAGLGITIQPGEWMSAKPSNLRGDKGGEVFGENIVEAAKELDFELVNCEAFRPDKKALAEGKFSLAEDDASTYAAGYMPDRERGDGKAEYDAVYDPDEFDVLMVELINHHNRSLIVRDPPSDYFSPNGEFPTPNELWEYGCQHRGRPPVMPRDVARTLLMHVSKGRESNYGLRVHSLYYQPLDRNFNGREVRFEGRKWLPRKVRHDPRDVTTISVLIDKRWVVFELVDRDADFRGWSLDEVKHHRKRQAAALRTAEHKKLISTIRLEDRIEHLTAAANANRAACPPQVGPKNKVNVAERRAQRRDDDRDTAWTALSVDEGAAQQASGNDNVEGPEDQSPAVPAAPVPAAVSDALARRRAMRDAALTQRKGV